MKVLKKESQLDVTAEPNETRYSIVFFLLSSVNIIKRTEYESAGCLRLSWIDNDTESLGLLSLGDKPLKR